MPYDLIVIGGGLAGAALAKTVAERGVRALVLEREQSFRDRVRGEVIVSWGIAEAQRLGIYEPLLQTCGHDIRWWHTSQGTSQGDLRDLVATTPTQSGILAFHHPTMQSVLLALAEAAGAEVWRGVTVTRVAAGSPVTVWVRGSQREERVEARLVVGADGRNSKVRAWGGFSVQRDPDRRMIAGVLHEGVQLPEDAVQLIPKSWRGQTVLIIPTGKQRFRSYFMYRKRNARRRGLSGAAREPAFLAACYQTGVPVEWYKGAKMIGPLAEFESAASWIEHPYRQGIVLVGDAAATSDPTFGQGLSLALRDVRVLCEHLLCRDDWTAAAHAYAEEHDQYYGALHRVEGWLGELFFEIGREAQARRARAIPRHVQEPERNFDLIALGPDVPSDEFARRRFFGED